MSKIEKNFQDVALDFAAKRFAEMLGIDNVPIVWNVNPYRVPKTDGSVPKSYPIVYMKTTRFGRQESAAYKKMVNTYQYGLLDNAGSRHALKLLPIVIDLQFFLITDNYQQAVKWATELLISRESHEDNSTLSFSIKSKHTPGFVITNQMILTSDSYDIQEVEYDESVPMEYRIEGTLTLNTRASKDGMKPDLIATLLVLESTDPDNAVQNVDGTTNGLYRDPNNNVIPIRIRSNID